MTGNGPFSCQEALERFAAFLDGDLAPAEGALLEGHLKECPSCRAESEGLAALDRDFSRLAVEAEIGLEDRVQAILAGALDAEGRGAEAISPRGSSTRVRVAASRSRRLLQPALLAASVLAGVAALVAFFASSYRQRVEEAEAHRVRLEAEQETLERKLAGEELRRREADRKRAFEEMKRAEEERLWAEQRLKEIEEHERELRRVMDLAAEDQRRRELEASVRKAREQAEEERRKAEEDLRRKEEEARRAREELAAAEREREKAEVQARAREAAPSKKDAQPPPRTPQIVAPLELAPYTLDPLKVDLAIGRGVEFIKGRLDQILDHKGERRPLELVLWALVHAGIPESDPDFQQILKIMLESRLERTYNVALQAMILEELDRVKHQVRLQQCAQFLVDNQCLNGQWSYGNPSLFAEDIHTGMGRDTASPPVRTTVREYVPSGPRLKPRVKVFVRVYKKRDGPPTGDNSNSQYALLGLRACHDAGVLLPPDVIRVAQRWWRDSQHDDPKRHPSEGQGWSYGGRSQVPAYGSMTAGAVGSLAICDYILHEDWRRDRFLQKGFLWLARHFSVAENPGKDDPTQWIYYYLYALERAGVLSGAEKFGIHDWYARGARALLEGQQQDGSWAGGQPVNDTCFAVLFLRRATRPLMDVETGGTRKR